MSNFTKFEDFELLEGTKYVLMSEVVWDIGVYKSGWQLILPRSFKFDISVPRGCEWIIDPHNRDILLAAAVHDKLLTDGHDAAFASSEFRRACIARGVDCFRAWALFLCTFLWTFTWK